MIHALLRAAALRRFAITGVMSLWRTGTCYLLKGSLFWREGWMEGVHVSIWTRIVCNERHLTSMYLTLVIVKYKCRLETGGI